MTLPAVSQSAAGDERRSDAFEIVHQGPDDWRENRALRLEALRLEPGAFASTYEGSVNQPEGWWRERLANPRCDTLLARAGERPVGMVVACRSEDEPEIGMIFGMYVTAGVRRQGVGRRLLEAALTRLEGYPAITTIRLWVRETHHSARRLYASLGFVAVEGAGELAPEGEIVMELPARH